VEAFVTVTSEPARTSTDPHCSKRFRRPVDHERRLAGDDGEHRVGARIGDGPERLIALEAQDLAPQSVGLEDGLAPDLLRREVNEALQVSVIHEGQGYGPTASRGKEEPGPSLR
jgi:hypothetical protein